MGLRVIAIEVLKAFIRRAGCKKWAVLRSILLKGILSSLLLSLLSGCWSNQEMDKSAFVLGAGIDKSDKGLHLSVEILKPSTGQSVGGGGAGGQGGNGQSKQSVVIERDAPSTLVGAREMIRDAKRRLVFTHNQVWIVSETLAQENILKPLDELERDQMVRLNSYLMVTPEKPSDILQTPTLYEQLTSLELVSALEGVEFVSDYTPMKVMDVLEKASGPVQGFYVPEISVRHDQTQPTTSITNTAVFKGEQMAGKLDMNQTMGLLWLQDEVKGGVVNIWQDEDPVSVELQHGKCDIRSQLKGEQLHVRVNIRAMGTLGHVGADTEISETWIRELEKSVSQKIKAQVEDALNILQQDLQIDVTRIGLITYRQYPREWQSLKNRWDEVFQEGEVEVKVETRISHKGLKNQYHGGIYDKPQNNPFQQLWRKSSYGVRLG